MKKSFMQKRLAQKINSKIKTKLKIDLITPPPSKIKDQVDLANKLLQWSLIPNSILIEDFPLQLNMEPHKFYSIATKNEYFSDALSIARHRLGSRIHKAWRSRKIPESYALKMLPIYNDKYKEYQLEKTERLSKALKNITPNIKVLTRDFTLPPEESQIGKKNDK